LSDSTKTFYQEKEKEAVSQDRRTHMNGYGYMIFCGRIALTIFVFLYFCITRAPTNPPALVMILFAFGRQQSCQPKAWKALFDPSPSQHH
jgi:hypothetical protein